MGQYTHVYPDLSQFGLNENMTEDELRDIMKQSNENCDIIENRYNEIWQHICAYVFATPNDIDETVEKVKCLIDNYVAERRLYMNNTYIYLLCEDAIHGIELKQYLKDNPDYYWQDFGNGLNQYNETKQQYIERITDEINNRKPSISKNHYYYSNCFDEGLEDTEHYMNKTANELLSMAAATPKDIFIANEENGTDVIFWLTRELEEKREWLDENIVSNCFAKLCERYEDTIKIL